MASLKGRLVKVLGSAFLSSASVASVDDVGAGFRRIVLRSDARPAAGTKLQLLLPSDDMRTYSPVTTDAGIELLGFKNAPGPGGTWVRQVKSGDALRFVGPQRSLELPPGPVIVVGDETSVAVAWSFEVARPGQVHAVIEAGDEGDVRAAADAVGLKQTTVVRRGDVDGAVKAVLAARAASPSASIGLTGGSVMLVAARTALREKGERDLRVKTYWVPGRSGLD